MYKISLPLWKIIWQFFKMLYRVITSPNDSTARYTPKRNKNIFHKKDLFMKIDYLKNSHNLKVENYGGIWW